MINIFRFQQLQIREPQAFFKIKFILRQGTDSIAEADGCSADGDLCGFIGHGFDLLPGFFLIDPAAQDQELVTAHADHHILGIREALFQQLRRFHQELVSHLVAQIIIDHLQVVDIQEEEGDRIPGRRKYFFLPDLQIISGIHAGQVVLVGDLLQMLFFLDLILVLQPLIGPADQPVDDKPEGRSQQKHHQQRTDRSDHIALIPLEFLMHRDRNLLQYFSCMIVHDTKTEGVISSRKIRIAYASQIAQLPYRTVVVEAFQDIKHIGIIHAECDYMRPHYDTLCIGINGDFLVLMYIFPHTI